MGKQALHSILWIPNAQRTRIELEIFYTVVLDLLSYLSVTNININNRIKQMFTTLFYPIRMAIINPYYICTINTTPNESSLELQVG
jgi:hypothetical protein